MVWSILYITISIGFAATCGNNPVRGSSRTAVGLSVTNGLIKASLPDYISLAPWLSQQYIYIFAALNIQVAFFLLKQLSPVWWSPTKQIHGSKARQRREWGLDQRQSEGWTMGWLASWDPLRCHCGYDTPAHCHHKYKYKLGQIQIQIQIQAGTHWGVTVVMTHQRTVTTSFHQNFDRFPVS